MSKITDEKLRELRALEFTPEEIAHLLRPVSVAEVKSRLNALDEKDAQEQRKQQALIESEQGKIARQHARAALVASLRPLPPDELLEEEDKPLFLPAPDLAAWVYTTFIEKSGLLFNKDHRHLLDAHIGFLWTNIPNSRQGNTVAGQAEKPQAQGGPWQKGKLEFLLHQWFGNVPDFLITLDANYAAVVPDLGFCALCEHELYHCAQALDKFGIPKWSKKTGKPIYAIQGHGVEEHVPIIRLYGAEAGAGQTVAFIEAAKLPPVHGAVKIATACGTCLK